MADQQFSIHKQEILQKQLKQTMSSLGEIDRRINELEALVLASFKKMQCDQVALYGMISEVKEAREAAKKFDLDGMPAQLPTAPPEEVAPAAAPEGWQSPQTKLI